MAKRKYTQAEREALGKPSKKKKPAPRRHQLGKITRNTKFSVLELDEYVKSLEKKNEDPPNILDAWTDEDGQLCLPVIPTLVVVGVMALLVL